MKRKIISLVLAAAVLMSLTACDNAPAESSESATETTLDMEQAIRDLDEYIGGYGVAFRMSSDEYPEQNIIYDFTGDGYDDVITDIQHGSGYVVVTIVLYDVYNQVFYTLGEMDHSYTIKSFEDGVLNVEEYIYPDSYTTGTVEFINDELVFIPASSVREPVDEEYAWQLQTIYDNIDVWRLSDEDNVEPDWYCVYAITDFDQDGLLEVCKRAEYNNGPVTQLWIYEVTSDGSIVELESDLEDPSVDYRSSNYPDFSIGLPVSYYQDGGVYRYLVHDCHSYGITCVYNDYGYLSIQDNRIVFDVVCTELAEDAGTVMTYYDADGNEISEAEYEALYNEYNSNADGNAWIRWFFDSEIDMDHITDSYSSFAG